MIKVLICDDQLYIREGLKSVLASDEEIKVVGTSENGRDALKLCSDLVPDVVLMDIVMPECNGIEGTRLIKEKFMKIKVIILTTFDDDDSIKKALEYGADGYVIKDIKPQELIMTVKAVAMGLNILHKKSLDSVVNQMGEKKASLITKGVTGVYLSANEKLIMSMIVEGLEYKEIAERLEITEGSLRNSVSALLKKLDLKDRVQLAVYALKNGLV